MFDIFVIELKIVESLYSKSGFCNISLKTSSSTIHISCSCCSGCCCDGCGCGVCGCCCDGCCCDGCGVCGCGCGLTSSSSLDSISMLSIGSSLLVFSDFLALESETKSNKSCSSPVSLPSPSSSLELPPPPWSVLLVLVLDFSVGISSERSWDSEPTFDSLLRS